MACLEASYTTIFSVDTGDACSLKKLGPKTFGAFDQRGANVRGRHAAIFGRPNIAEQVVGVHWRPALFGFAGANRGGINATGIRQSLLTYNVRHAVRPSCERKRAFLDPADILAGFFLKLAVEIYRILDDPYLIMRMAQDAYLRC